jgi:hypothetical protein
MFPAIIIKKLDIFLIEDIQVKLLNILKILNMKGFDMLKKLMNRICKELLGLVTIIICMIIVATLMYTVAWGNDTVVIIINDPRHKHANRTGAKAYTHYWEENKQTGNLERVDRVLTRLKGGKVRVRETRKYWKENKSKGRIERKIEVKRIGVGVPKKYLTCTEGGHCP